jgi:RecQ family ATP-dependent DNA helicase
MKTEAYYFSKITDCINKYRTDNSIFVLQGIGKECLDKFNDEVIDDKSTFLSENHADFDKTWFANFFAALNKPKDYHLISYAQLAYLFNYIDPSFFSDRLIIIKDNLRQLYPLPEALYLERSENENIEKRSESMPLHHAEQFKIEDNYYYALNSVCQKLTTIELHKEELELQLKDHIDNAEVIDISDLYELDVFFNEFIKTGETTTAFVKFHKKQPVNKQIESTLRKMNFFLNQLGGALYFLPEVSVDDSYEPLIETKEALKTYWGKQADFRSLKVYKNPNSSSEIIEISQGLIVDTIIEEYENAKAKKDVRDLFLTAPTGAGKSLLFQLPAFHVSKKGDVTIVVSPLIALMKDQVKAIIGDRNYTKVAYLNSELSLIDRDRIIESCKDGELDILYMSPELLLSYDISHFIGERNLGLLVIDEAHLITTWGRDFRVDYWFLGNHIRKIRKYRNIKFPMVAVTATAIYGGSNDMVFDSIDSLVMQNPHIFIGQVKRDDIEFVINNYDKFGAQYERSKLNQTVSFIRSINEVGLKCLVYTPYTKHIRQILGELGQENIAAGYYGSLDSNLKELAYRQFKGGERNIMVSTKAFGMGVDISDIQVVYHHAPSGLLPDYVQEIGRVARDPKIKGFATLNYSEQDQRFSKALHGMSALRQHQIREVLQKIFKAYVKNESRNLLLSIDDFGHIFENALDLDQKVLTALMMIEKDYLAKYRFSVLIARPKKLFVIVFAKVSHREYDVLKSNFSNAIREVSRRKQDSIIELDLDKVWTQKFSDKSFPSLKREFYLGNVFRPLGVNCVPQLKMSFERSEDYQSAYAKLDNVFDALRKSFVQMEGFFDQQMLKEKLCAIINDELKSEKLSKFVIATFSGRMIQPGVIEDNAFLQRRKDSGGFKYRVYNNRYLQIFANMLRRYSKLFENTSDSVVTRYITNRESNSITSVRLGYFIEMLEIGTFEIKGGENPMVFIRVNGTEIIERDSRNGFYKNSLLEKTLERHYISNQIFDHFFLNNFDNQERWDFIEDFFLGEDVDALLTNYQSDQTNNVDIIEVLKKKSKNAVKRKKSREDKEDSIHIFHANSKTFYKMDNLLTINTGNNNWETKKIGEWLNHNPVALDKERKKHNLKVDGKVFEILVNRLKLKHHDYFKNSLGLDLRISFKGYDKPVKAIIPYKNRPVEFYKWWCNNKDEVKLTFKQKIELIDKVALSQPKVLKTAHKKLVNK